MNSKDLTELKLELKKLVLRESDKEDEFTVTDINDEDALFGSNTRLALDSLDALQISVAVFKKYGARIEGAKDGRIAMASINALADFIHAAD